MAHGPQELESQLQQFGEYVLRKRLVRQSAAPYVVGWVRRFLTRPADGRSLADRVRAFCESLERTGKAPDWQVRQADESLRIYFLHFLDRPDWNQPQDDVPADPAGRVDILQALERMRLRLRTRHYSCRTETTYVDWARRFMAWVAEEQREPRPAIDAAAVRNFLTHLAVRRGVSASTQNQAMAAALFLCREVLGIQIEGLQQAVRARRGQRLPAVLSVPETAALLSALRGTAALMAAMIYGGGLRVSECCALRIKDLDFEQGLIFVRAGKSDKDRSTLRAEAVRGPLREQLRRCEAIHRSDRTADVPGVMVPDALARKYPNAGRELGWFATMIYTHVVRDLRAPACSPLDLLGAGRPALRSAGSSSRSPGGRGAA